MSRQLAKNTLYEMIESIPYMDDIEIEDLLEMLASHSLLLKSSRNQILFQLRREFSHEECTTQWIKDEIIEFNLSGRIIRYKYINDLYYELSDDVQSSLGITYNPILSKLIHTIFIV